MPDENIGNSRSKTIIEFLLKSNPNISIELISTTFSHVYKNQRKYTVKDNDKYKFTLLYEPGYKKNVSLKRFYSHYIFGKNLYKYLNKMEQKPDIIYCLIPSLDAGKACAKYAKKNNIRFIIDIQDIWPEAFKLVFEVPTGKILGAQAIGKGDADKRIDVIAAMITMHATLENLKELELCYAPPFSTAKDIVNVAALVGLNILYGEYRQVHVEDVRSLVENDAYIVDVREENEYMAGHLRNAHNIPLSQLRARMNGIPKDREVYLHCRSAQRSYYALCVLRGNGFDRVTNISGSFLGICLYEYYQDKSEGRKPIVTAYQFD